MIRDKICLGALFGKFTKCNFGLYSDYKKKKKKSYLLFKIFVVLTGSSKNSVIAICVPKCGTLVSFTLLALEVVFCKY